MGVDHRVTLTKRHAFRTRGNKIKTIKTPGGRYAAQYIGKSCRGVHCGDCKIKLPGIKNMSSIQLKNCKKREKTVSRAYGGSRCSNCVRQRVVRAFLIEEQKIVKKVLAEKMKKAKTDA